MFTLELYQLPSYVLTTMIINIPAGRVQHATRLNYFESYVFLFYNTG